MTKRTLLAVAIALVLVSPAVRTGSTPVRFLHEAVVSQSDLASAVGARILSEGGNAIDAAVATAFALAVTHPAAGNIGGGGFIVYRPATGEPAAFDFRETAPARSSPTMFVRGRHIRRRPASPESSGRRDAGHRRRPAHGLESTWVEAMEGAGRAGRRLARDGFPVSVGLARSLEGSSPDSSAILPRSPSSRRTACRIRPATFSSSPISPGRCSGLPTTARRDSTKARPRFFSKRKWPPTAG